LNKKEIVFNMSYKDELLDAMNLLNDNGYKFIGQNVVAGGTSMFHTFKHLLEKQRIELPVFEEVQMGISTGMALNGEKVCSIYPRMDFLILALNQLINHLDKAEEMSDGQFKPKVIIRTCVGSTEPLMPGPQHCKNYTEALRKMVTNIDVVELLTPEDVYKEYEKAINSDRSTILVEHSDLYNSDLTEELIKSRQQEVIR